MEILKKKLPLAFLLSSGVLILVSFIVFAMNARSLAFPLILHFDKIRGIDMFGSVGNVFGIWLFTFLMVGVNIVLAEAFFYRERVLSYLFLGTNLFISILLTIVIGLIVSVN